MKIKILPIFLILLLLLSVSSCNNVFLQNTETTLADTDMDNETTTPEDVETTTLEDTDTTAPGDVDDSNTGTNHNDVITDVPPGYIYPIRFDTLVELRASLSKESEDAFYAKYSETELTHAQADALTSFVTKLQLQGICIPYIDGKAITLRNREGLPNISLFVSDTYDLPWIYFHPQVSTGENYFIKVTYLPDDILTTQKDPIASEIIKILSPNSPNIDNLGIQHEKIYNQKVQLKDREVTALVCEYKNDNRNSTTFVYGDLLVEIRSAPTGWNTQWFSKLSFGILDE